MTYEAWEFSRKLAYVCPIKIDTKNGPMYFVHAVYYTIIELSRRNAGKGSNEVLTLTPTLLGALLVAAGFFYVDKDVLHVVRDGFVKGEIEEPVLIRRVLPNRLLCLECGDTIESKSLHDFHECSCGNITVDGGLQYYKRSFKNGAGFRVVDWDDSVIGSDDPSSSTLLQVPFPNR